MPKPFVEYRAESDALIAAMDSLGKAAGAIHALAHMQRRPQLLHIRDLIEGVRQQLPGLVTSLAPSRASVEETLGERKRAEGARRGIKIVT